MLSTFGLRNACGMTALIRALVRRTSIGSSSSLIWSETFWMSGDVSTT